MNVEEIKQKKQELGEKIAVLLNGFENETGVQVYDELGHEIYKVYVAEVEVKL